MTTEPAGSPPALVDTDVATWLLTDVAEAQPWKAILRGRLLAISFATFGELMALPCVRRWQAPRTQAWEGSIRRTFVVLPHNAEIARLWAPMHAKLRGHLHGQGTNDLWTAAAALAADPPLPIATGNQGDFQTIAADCGVSLLSPEISERLADDTGTSRSISRNS